MNKVTVGLPEYFAQIFHSDKIHDNKNVMVMITVFEIRYVHLSLHTLFELIFTLNDHG